MTESPVCLRSGCGHDESCHDSEAGYCEDCPCTGFLSEESFESSSEEDEVEELHLGEENG